VRILILRGQCRAALSSEAKNGETAGFSPSRKLFPGAPSREEIPKCVRCVCV